MVLEDNKTLISCQTNKLQNLVGFKIKQKQKKIVHSSDKIEKKFYLNLHFAPPIQMWLNLLPDLFSTISQFFHADVS